MGALCAKPADDAPTEDSSDQKLSVLITTEKSLSDTVEPSITTIEPGKLYIQIGGHDVSGFAAWKEMANGMTSAPEKPPHMKMVKEFWFGPQNLPYSVRAFHIIEGKENLKAVSALFAPDSEFAKGFASNPVIKAPLTWNQLEVRIARNLDAKMQDGWVLGVYARAIPDFEKWLQVFSAPDAIKMQMNMGIVKSFGGVLMNTDACIQKSEWASDSYTVAVAIHTFRCMDDKVKFDHIFDPSAAMFSKMLENLPAGIRSEPFRNETVGPIFTCQGEVPSPDPVTKLEPGKLYIQIGCHDVSGYAAWKEMANGMTSAPEKPPHMKMVKEFWLGPQKLPYSVRAFHVIEGKENLDSVSALFAPDSEFAKGFTSNPVIKAPITWNQFEVRVAHNMNVKMQDGWVLGVYARAIPDVDQWIDLFAASTSVQMQKNMGIVKSFGGILINTDALKSAWASEINTVAVAVHTFRSMDDKVKFDHVFDPSAPLFKGMLEKLPEGVRAEPFQSETVGPIFILPGA